VIENNENQIDKKCCKIRDHLANERTFLAWIRTSIGIMVFGFVIEKFSLFIKQMNFFIAKSDSSYSLIKSPFLQGYSSIFGVFLVGLGALLCFLAFIKYKKIEKQIQNETFEPSTLLNIMLTLSVLLIGIFLVIYLNTSLGT
jgi:uncharacterized membrane protein YidH (DUF202 family)